MVILAWLSTFGLKYVTTQVENSALKKKNLKSVNFMTKVNAL